MDGDKTAQLIYYAILIFAVAGALIGPMLRAPGKVLQQALIWVSLFLALIAGYGLWPDISRALRPATAHVSNGAVELQRGTDGHFYADLDIDGTIVTFAIDTGASEIVLNRADAAADRLRSRYTQLHRPGADRQRHCRHRPRPTEPRHARPPSRTGTCRHRERRRSGHIPPRHVYLARYSLAIEGNRLRLAR